MATYLRQAATADGACGLAAGLLAFLIRFASMGDHPLSYLVVSLLLPFVWLVTLLAAGAYDSRFIGVGSDEFRRVFNAGIFLTAAIAVIAYASKTHLARGYV